MKCQICHREFKSKTRRKTCSKRCANKLRARTRAKNRHLSGRYYKGTYKGIKCDSRWELAFLLFCLYKGLPIQRCPYTFHYTIRGKEHTYYPDFIINKTIYEIKGIHRKNLRAKLECVKRAGFDIVLIDKTKIQPYLEWCYKKFKTEHIEKLFD